MKSIDEQLGEIRAELEKIHRRAGFQGLPTVLTMEQAAHELSCGLTKLRGLIKRRLLMTVMIGDRRMVPASEIRRLSAIDEPSKASEAKPVRSGLQDPDALRRRR